MSFNDEFEKTAIVGAALGALARGGMSLARGFGKAIKNVSTKSGPKLKTGIKAFKQELTPLNVGLTGSMVGKSKKPPINIAPRRSAMSQVPRVGMGAPNVRI